MSSGLEWERFGVITGGDEVWILPPPTLSEKGEGIPNFVHFPFFFHRTVSNRFHKMRLNKIGREESRTESCT